MKAPYEEIDALNMISILADHKTDVSLVRDFGSLEQTKERGISLPDLGWIDDDYETHRRQMLTPPVEVACRSLQQMLHEQCKAKKEMKDYLHIEPNLLIPLHIETSENAWF